MSAGLVCVNSNCARGGYAASGPVCQACGQATHRVDEPGLVVPLPNPQGSGAIEKIEKVSEVGSRVMYGGFWVVIAILAVIGGFAALSNGSAVGLLGIGIGGLAGIYARYIIKGGRFRILFW